VIHIFRLVHNNAKSNQ